MDKSYNKVEISEEELQSLEEPPTPTTESDTNAVVEAKPESEESSNEEVETTPEEVKESEDVKEGFEIDGETYDLDTILNWKDDSSNKEKWSKSNTETAQKLSKWNKLAEKINGDEDFREHLKDYFFDNPDEADKLLGEKLEIFNEEVEKEPSAMEKRVEALEEVESDRLQELRVDNLDKQMTDLEEQNPDLLNEKTTLEFLKFTDKNSKRFEVDGMPNLTLAFKEWSYDQLKDQLTHYKKLEQNKSRNSGKVVGKSQIGAVEESKPKQYTNMKQISIKDPDIAKYFD